MLKLKNIVGLYIYNYFKRSLDVNECAEDETLCQPGTCMNTIGAYKCDCHKGYEVGDGGKKCVGIIFVYPGSCNFWTFGLVLVKCYLMTFYEQCKFRFFLTG